MAWVTGAPTLRRCDTWLWARSAVSVTKQRSDLIGMDNLLMVMQLLKSKLVWIICIMADMTGILKDFSLPIFYFITAGQFDVCILIHEDLRVAI